MSVFQELYDRWINLTPQEDFPRNFALWLVAGSGPAPPALPIRRRYFKCRASPNRVASDRGRPPRGWPHQSRSQICCYDD